MHNAGGEYFVHPFRQNIYETRSLSPLRAPPSTWRPFGPTWLHHSHASGAQAMCPTPPSITSYHYFLAFRFFQKRSCLNFFWIFFVWCFLICVFIILFNFFGIFLKLFFVNFFRTFFRLFDSRFPRYRPMTGFVMSRSRSSYCSRNISCPIFIREHLA